MLEAAEHNSSAVLHFGARVAPQTNKFDVELLVRCLRTRKFTLGQFRLSSGRHTLACSGNHFGWSNQAFFRFIRGEDRFL
jgi:hypothetical protein